MKGKYILPLLLAWLLAVVAVMAVAADLVYTGIALCISACAILVIALIDKHING